MKYFDVKFKFTFLAISLCSVMFFTLPSLAQSTEGQTLVQDDVSADSPPSLSDYLRKEGVATADTASEGAGDDPSGVNFPPVDGQSLQTDPVIEESPEVVKAKADAALRKEAFKATSEALMPLKPSEIRRMLELI
jgi:hypothetical protein